MKRTVRNVCFLCSELSGYFLRCIRVFLEDTGAHATVVHWPINKIAPFRFETAPGLTLWSREGLDRQAIERIVVSNSPDLVYVAGWMDRDYLWAARRLRATGVPVVGGMDNAWSGSIRQQFAVATAGFTVRRLFSHAWVPGLPQYEFARRLGFDRDRVLTGLYSAAVGQFELGRAGSHPGLRELLFVGRLIPEKGIIELYRAFHRAVGGDGRWRLRIVGEGPLRSQLSNTDSCVVGEFVQPAELPNVAATASAFVLPSFWEPWGVALHEMAAAGLPLIASKACGSATAFLRHGYNGYSFDQGVEGSLLQALEVLFSLSDSQLTVMSRRSRELSKSITPEMWSATLQSVLT